MKKMMGEKKEKTYFMAKIREEDCIYSMEVSNEEIVAI
jgi:hypothetical protein